MKKTYVALLIDSSSSMIHIREAARKAFNSMLDTFKQEDGESSQIFMTVIGFADRPYTILPVGSVSGIKPLSNYNPNGNTAMFDGVATGIDALKRVGGRAKDTSFLVMVVTDGEENCSIKYNSRSLNKLMADLQATDKWTFAFQVPRGAARSINSQFGIPMENIREWEQTNVGAVEMGNANNNAIRTYMSARAGGQTAVRNFYQPITTDLSNITTTSIKRTLDDVTDKYKLLEVKSEAQIKPFVERKTKKLYSLGDAFYQLMKIEKVQPGKAILLLHKQKQIIYGGVGARDTIGLPDGEYARVNPGNHGDYDIFVQSTSTNRILPRGTKVLVKA